VQLRVGSRGVGCRVSGVGCRVRDPSGLDNAAVPSAMRYSITSAFFPLPWKKVYLITAESAVLANALVR
jgi:hypothetical protein